MKYDVVVIGSGLGGLVCAYILSREGRSVLLLEKGTQPGGCMQSYCRKGMWYDTGFHYVGGLDEGQSLHSVFRYLGLLRLPWQRLDMYFDRVTIGGKTYPFAQGFDRFGETLAEYFPDKHRALGDYVNLLRRCCAEQYRIFSSSSSEIYALPELEIGAYPYLKEKFGDSPLIDVLGGTSLKMELRQESLPLLTFMHGNSSFIESSWRLKGDGSLIVRSLTDSIRSYGGEIVCRAEVQELVEKNGSVVQAVCTDGRVYEGDVFISDVHPAVTCGWVKRSDRMKRIFRNRINSIENTFGMCTVSLLVKPDTLRYFNWNHYVYRKPNVWTFYLDDTSVGGVLVCCRIPENGSCYARQVDLLTPMRWEQCKKWIGTTVGHRGEDYVRMKERVADECIALAEEVVPGLRDMIVERYVSTPLTYRDYTSSPEGSAYGMRKDFRNPIMTLLSLHTPIPNLLLTGQNVMVHGVHGTTITAFLTCAEVVGKERIWEIIKE